MCVCVCAWHRILTAPHACIRRACPMQLSQCTSNHTHQPRDGADMCAVDTFISVRFSFSLSRSFTPEQWAREDYAGQNTSCHGTGRHCLLLLVWEFPVEHARRGFGSNCGNGLVKHTSGSRCISFALQLNPVWAGFAQLCFLLLEGSATNRYIIIAGILIRLQLEPSS